MLQFPIDKLGEHLEFAKDRAPETSSGHLSMVHQLRTVHTFILCEKSDALVERQSWSSSNLPTCDSWIALALASTASESRASRIFRERMMPHEGKGYQTHEGGKTVVESRST